MESTVKKLNFITVKRDIEIRGDKRYITQFRYSDNDHWCFALPVKSMYLQTIEDCKAQIEKNDWAPGPIQFRIAEIKNDGSLEAKVNSMKPSQLLEEILNCMGITATANVDMGTFGQLNKQGRLVACLAVFAEFNIVGKHFDDDDYCIDSKRADALGVDEFWLDDFELGFDALSTGDFETYAKAMREIGIRMNADWFKGIQIPSLNNMNWDSDESIEAMEVAIAEMKKRNL